MLRQGTLAEAKIVEARKRELELLQRKTTCLMVAKNKPPSTCDWPYCGCAESEPEQEWLFQPRRGPDCKAMVAQEPPASCTWPQCECNSEARKKPPAGGPERGEGFVCDVVVDKRPPALCNWPCCGCLRKETA